MSESIEPLDLMPNVKRPVFNFTGMAMTDPPDPDLYPPATHKINYSEIPRISVFLLPRFLSVLLPSLCALLLFSFLVGLRLHSRMAGSVLQRLPYGVSLRLSVGKKIPLTCRLFAIKPTAENSKSKSSKAKRRALQMKRKPRKGITPNLKSKKQI